MANVVASGGNQTRTQPATGRLTLYAHARRSTPRPPAPAQRAKVASPRRHRLRSRPRTIGLRLSAPGPAGPRHPRPAPSPAYSCNGCHRGPRSAPAPCRRGWMPALRTQLSTTAVHWRRAPAHAARPGMMCRCLPDGLSGAGRSRHHRLLRSRRHQALRVLVHEPGETLAIPYCRRVAPAPGTRQHRSWVSRRPRAPHPSTHAGACGFRAGRRHFAHLARARSSFLAERCR